MKRWQIMYKRNPAPATPGIIEASSEAVAVRVAERWCALNNARFIGGSVKPEVLADESILKISIEPEVAEALPDAVASTTAAHAE